MKYSIKRTGDLIEVDFHGEQKTPDIADLREDIIKLSEGKPRNILVDLHGVTGREEMPTNLHDFFDGLPFKRYAIYGGAPPSVVRTKHLVNSLPDNPNLRFFRNEEDARAWLES